MSCDPTPTETLFTTITSLNFVNTFSTTTQTIAGSISSISVPPCSSSLDGACTGDTQLPTFAVSTLPDQVEVVTIPFVITETDTEVIPTLTLFAPCSSTSLFQTSTTASAFSSETDDTSVYSTIPGPSPTSSLPSSTLPPESSVTLEPVSSAIATELFDGSTFTVYTAISTVTVDDSSGTSTTSGGPPTPQQQQRQSRNESSLGPILGGALGGFLSLLIVVGIIAFVIHRAKTRYDDSDASEVDDTPSRPPTRADPSDKPKPYIYGAVGGTRSGVLLSQTPPNTPPPTELHHSQPSSSSLGRRSRAPSGALEGRPDSMTGLLTQTNWSSSPTSSMLLSRDGSPRHPVASSTEFGARPTSVYSSASMPVLEDRRRSRSSLAALSVNLHSPTLDHPGSNADTGGNLRTQTPGDRDGQLSQNVDEPYNPYTELENTPKPLSDLQASIPSPPSPSFGRAPKR